MQIQLRQTEIVEALKQYIAKQGISLQGKTVEISFTAGRKESGVSADITIEDSGKRLPDLVADEAAETAPAKPTLSVVSAPQAPVAISPVPQATAAIATLETDKALAEAKRADPPFVPDVKPEAAAPAAAEAQAMASTGEKKTSSLFG